MTTSQAVIRQLLQRGNAVVIGQTPPAIRRPIFTVSNAGLAGHRIQLVIGPAVTRPPVPVELFDAVQQEEIKTEASLKTEDGFEQFHTSEEPEEGTFDETTGEFELVQEDAKVTWLAYFI